MKKLLTLALIGALVLSALPISAMAYSPPPDHPEIAMQINGQWTGPLAPYKFTGISYCKTFDVQVIALAFTDLYAYEFYLTWDQDYLSLVDHEVKHIHTADFVLVEEVLDTDADGRPDTYHQAVTAVAPAEGFTGTGAIANLQFHIDNDAQWEGPGSQVDIVFTIHDTKTSDSCTVPIPNSEQGGNVKLIPVQPDIKMLPPVTYKSVVGETFTVQFEIQNIVKMKSFEFFVYWDPVQLTTDAQNVIIKSFLPPPYLITIIEVGTGVLHIGAEIPCEKPCINGTGELFGITFTTLNPWEGIDGGIPPYFEVPASPPDIPHPLWCPQVCWNYINIEGGIDKVDGTIQWLGAPDGVAVKSPDIVFNPSTGRGPPDVMVPGGSDGKTSTKFVYNLPCPQWPGAFVIGYYEFRPIPGDLDLDGHCDIIDLSAMAKYYGRFNGDGLTPAWAKIFGFDLDGNGIIDIYDVVIVAKNICRTEPCPDNPWPIFDP